MLSNHPLPRQDPGLFEHEAGCTTYDLPDMAMHAFAAVDTAPSSSTASHHQPRGAKASVPVSKQGLAGRLRLRDKQAATNRAAVLRAHRERAAHPHKARGMIAHGFTAVASEVARFASEWIEGGDVPCTALAQLCDGLAANVDESEDSALVDFAESLLCQTNVVGVLSALLEQPWEVPLQPSRHEARVLALRCLANLRMLAHEYAAARSRLNLHLGDSVALHVVRTYELTAGSEGPEQVLPASALRALDHALTVASQRCPADLIEGMSRLHGWEVVANVLPVLNATRLCCEVADPTVEGSADVLRYLACVLDQCPSPAQWRTAQETISEDYVESVELAVLALERYASHARGYYDVQPYVSWGALMTLAECHPSREVGLVAMALLSKYEEAVAAAAASSPLLDWCVDHVQRMSSRLVALNILRHVPRLVGARMGVGSPLFGALCGVVRGTDRLGRLQCIKLLVTLRSAGLVKQVLDFCEYNSTALEALLNSPAEDAWPGSDDRAELDAEEIELVEDLLQIIDVDPFS